MIGTRPSKGAMPYLTENGELVIPANCLGRYKHWQRDSAPASRKPHNIWQILAELDAPLKAWKRYAYAENLSPENHERFCKGAAQQGDGFLYCVGCGRYQEKQGGIL
jgi:hypothetical protein